MSSLLEGQDTAQVCSSKAIGGAVSWKGFEAFPGGLRLVSESLPRPHGGKQGQGPSFPRGDPRMCLSRSTLEFPLRVSLPQSSQDSAFFFMIVRKPG